MIAKCIRWSAHNLLLVLFLTVIVTGFVSMPCVMYR